MQQMFNCPRCGWQNMIGQRFCGSCGEVFQYNCPYCNAVVDPAYTSCPSCGAYLTWSFQQQPEPPSAPQEPAFQQPFQQQYPQQPQQEYQQPAQQPYHQPPQQPPFQQQNPAAPSQPRKPADPATKEALKKKRRMNQIIVLAAATGLLICIGIAIYLTLTTFSGNSSPSAPATPAASSSNQTSESIIENSAFIAMETTGCFNPPHN